MYRDRHGKIRWRFRKRGMAEQQCTLAFDSPDWWTWYFACLAGERRQIAEDRSGPGTFTALIAAYYLSQEWKALRPATQTAYRGELERFRSKHGEKRVRHLEQRYVLGMRDEMSGPAAANNLLRVLRGLIAFAVSRNWRSDDPTQGIRRLKYRTDGFHTWSEDEIEKFEAFWGVGTRERLAFDLLLYTGQRSGDVRLMSAGQICDGYLSLRQGKTGEALQIPIHERLRASLDACPSPHLLLLPTQYGQAFTAKGFGNWFSEAARAAGLTDCSAHGLRKSAATRLADAGATTHEIMAITGHRSLKEAERYTRLADQKRNAAEAMKKIERTDRERNRV
jgi:integrase